MVLTLAALGAAPAPTAGAQEVQPYRANDAGGFLNVLPPGQSGHASGAQSLAFLTSGARPPHSSDQLGMYEDIVFSSPTLSPNRLTDFFKDASFGVPEGQEAGRYRPREDVTIVRDERFGVPHIYGTDRSGAMFGAGYVGAEDRLFLMDVLRHAGRAQLSAFIGGAAGNRAMDRDQWRNAAYEEADLTRQYEVADDLYGRQGTQVQEDVRHYVAGINKYICEANPAKAAECAAQGISPAPTSGATNGTTPAEKLPGVYAAVQPISPAITTGAPHLWKVEDVIATASLVGGIFGKGGGRELDSAVALQEAIDKFGADGDKVWSDFRSAEDPEAPVTTGGAFPYLARPDNPAGDSSALPKQGSVQASASASSGGLGGLPAGPLGRLSVPRSTSNALLVSGAESQSGRPLAVFGPQTGYFAPQLLMELDIHAPAAGGKQGIDARGAAFAGVNLYVQLGRGRDYAWSATSAGQDNTDTFALELCRRPGDPANPPLGEYSGYVYRGECEPFETLTRQNSWTQEAPAEPPAPGSDTLITRRTKLGLEIARARLNDAEETPVVYVRLRSTYMHEADSAAGFVDFNDPELMRNPEAFRRAADKIGFTFNWFFINARDIAYFNSGWNPERPEQGGELLADPNFPVRACPDGSAQTCEYEWVGWNPELWTSERTPASEHPQAVNPAYLTSWNNKQAPQYRAADDNWSYQPLFRSLPLDDRIRGAIGGGQTMTLAQLVDAMEDAATVDLRGDKVLPIALAVLETGLPGGLQDEVAKLRAWVEDGAHRRDKDRNGHYEHSDAIRIMDAWWPLWVEAQFKPVLGQDLYNAITNMVGLDDNPRSHLGSAWISGWYGYVHKDLRSVLGRQVAGPYSREYCGGGDLADCRQLLADTLSQASTEDPYAGGAGECGQDPRHAMDRQMCHDAIRHTAAGVVTEPDTHWQNRPTFQQVVEVRAAQAGGGGSDEPEETAQPEDEPDDEDDPRGDRPEVTGNARPGSASLPFTGLVVALLLALGLGLLGGGAWLRRRRG